MRITPLDIHSHRFARRFSGFDPGEVESFLRMVADDYEALLLENESLQDRIRRLDSRVEELSANEALLKETLVSAQALSEEMRASATKESEVLVSEAEVRAERVLDAAHRRAARLAEEIREMRGLRTRLAAALRTAIETHLSLVDGLEQAPEEVDPILEGKIAYLDQPAPAERASESGGGT